MWKARPIKRKIFDNLRWIEIVFVLGSSFTAWYFGISILSIIIFWVVYAMLSVGSLFFFLWFRRRMKRKHKDWFYEAKDE
jgi:hypothetical protein